MKKRKGRISAIREFALLTKQYRMILCGNLKNLGISMAFPIIAAIITVWIAGEDMFVSMEATKSACFVLVSSAIWGGLFNSIQTVVKERAMVKRDIVSGGMRIGCYTLSRALLQLILCMAQTLILSLSVIGVHLVYENEIPESGIIFDHTMLEIYISLLLLMYAADAMGLMISCIVKKAEAASVMAPYILIVQLIFSGILFTLDGATEYASYPMISRWGMEALGSICNCNDLPLSIVMKNESLEGIIEHTAEEMFEYEPAHLWKVWLILLGFCVGALVIGNVMLHRVRYDSRE